MSAVTQAEVAAIYEAMRAGGLMPAVGAMGKFVDVNTDADIPAASASNEGTVYFVATGPSLWKSNGVSNIQISGGGSSPTTWLARGSAAQAGASRRLTDVGNNPLVMMRANGTRWTPDGNEQCIYELAAPVLSVNTAPAGVNTQTVTFPPVTIPGNLMGLSGAIIIQVGWELVDGTPLTRVGDMQWGGSPMYTDAASLHRRFNLTRTIINQNNAAMQHILERAADYGTDQTVNTTGQDKTKDTTADVIIVGSVISTFATAVSARLHRYRVLWRGQQA